MQKQLQVSDFRFSNELLANEGLQSEI